MSAALKNDRARMKCPADLRESRRSSAAPELVDIMSLYLLGDLIMLFLDGSIFSEILFSALILMLGFGFCVSKSRRINIDCGGRCVFSYAASIIIAK